MTKVTSDRANQKAFSVGELLLVALVLVLMAVALGCQKKEKSTPVPPAADQKTWKSIPAGETKTSGPPDHHSILTKNLKQPIPAQTFSRSDRIYLLTVWTGLQGNHEIKVLWVRPDGTVQETVRLNEKIPTISKTYTTWAYLSFTKGLLNISPTEGKFIGAWKAQLFLDGKLLKEFDFTVY
jgi:hypothetical protein